MALVLCLRMPVSLATLVWLLALADAAELPYSPTHLFLPTGNVSNVLYALQPPSATNPNGKFQSLNIQSSFRSHDPEFKTLSDTLPFLSDTAHSYTPSLDPDGGISVYTGDCATGTAASALWRFVPDATSSGVQGTWTKGALAFSNSSSKGSSQIGPNYLASSISFSPTAREEDTSVSIFGGMCPYGNATAADWMSAASYSNQMLVFQPKKNTQVNYELVPSKGAPIAEAGFSITPLSPTVSHSSSGITSQQQQFLLLGGHTHSAFINMSQVAVFSLPQATWIFLPVNQLRASPSPARGAQQVVEPRSGHTAVLSSDGTKVIVVGGWVGDTSTAAEPQIAVLNVGQGYGGAGPWSWDAPTTDNSPFKNGSSVYGHGAVMLPGNVLMLSGGFNIPDGQQSKAEREAQTRSTRTFLYNVTSNEWVDSYDGSAEDSMISAMSQDNVSPGPLSTPSQKAGLGAGLPLGCAAVGVVLVFAYIYWQRLRKKRQALSERQLRERDVYSHHNATTRTRPPLVLNPFADHHVEEMGETSPQTASEVHRSSYPAPTNSWNQVRDAERTGLDLNLPSPQRGLRKGRYYSNVRAEEAQTPHRGSAPFMPIDEREEDEMASTSGLQTSAERPVSDPFRDPLSPSLLRIDTSYSATGAHADQRPMSPVEERQHEMQAWMKDWETAGMALHTGPSPRTTIPVRSPPNGPRALHRERSRKKREDQSPMTEIAAQPDSAPTFTPHQVSASRLGSWVGSVRNSILGTNLASWRSASAAPSTNTYGHIDASFEPYTDLPSSTGSSSPTKEVPRPARRSVSDSGNAFWQVKKGASAWASRPQSGESLYCEDENGEDWDPEDAIRERVVQVMFTMPREQLRVVNADPDAVSDGTETLNEKEDEGEKLADGELARNESVRSESVYSPRIGC